MKLSSQIDSGNFLSSLTRLLGESSIENRFRRTSSFEWFLFCLIFGFEVEEVSHIYLSDGKIQNKWAGLFRWSWKTYLAKILTRVPFDA